MTLKVRKTTKTEAVFLAVTLTASSLATLEVLPKTIKSIEKQSAIVEAEIKKKKPTNPRDAFNVGFLVGGVVGALATIKVVAAKINGHP